MAKYFAFLLGRGPGALGPVPVLKRSSLEEMWRPVLPASDTEAMGDSVTTSFFVKHAAGTRLIGHTGSQRGFRAFFYLEPLSGTAVAAAFNTAPVDEGPNAHPNIALIREGVLQQLTPVFSLFAHSAKPGEGGRPR
jgi:hypothetical protein